MTAPLISQGINLNLPKAEAPAVKPQNEPLVLEINAEAQPAGHKNLGSPYKNA